ncbi:MAG TPA: MFS transporter [Chthonomonadaceae bacterium]|nr:MFS transporter [Chthonomonadaceae bacterium]
MRHEPSSESATDTQAAAASETAEHALRRQRELAAIWRALRHRNYQLFFSGQFISLIGTWMQSVAQSWLVYRLTGSAALLGAVGFASQIPVFLLSPLGGTVADRYDRRRILVGTQTASMLLAFVLAALTLLRLIQVWQIFLLAALLGVVNAFDIPTRQAFVVEMVGKEDLLNAIALNSSMVNGARIVGPALAGILVAAIGEGWCFFANAVSYIAVIIGLLLMQLPPFERYPHVGSALAHIWEGFHFVWLTGPIRALLLLLGLVSLAGMPYAVLMPIFAENILHSGSSGLGVLMGASGVGALLGALSLAARQGVRGLGRWVLFSAAGFGVSLILFSLSHTFWLSAVLLLPVGFTMMIQMAATNTLIQAMVPDALRGRVMAVYSMMFMGMAPLGALLAGVLAQRIGAPGMVALGGVVTIAGAFVFGLRLPALREQARPLLITQEMVAGDPPEEVMSAGAR